MARKIFCMSRAPLYKLADELSKSGYKWTSKLFNLPKIKRNKAIETKNTNFSENFHRGNFRTNGKRSISYKFQLHVSLKSQTKNTNKNVYNFFYRLSNNPSQIKNQWQTKQKDVASPALQRLLQPSFSLRTTHTHTPSHITYWNTYPHWWRKAFAIKTNSEVFGFWSDLLHDVVEELGLLFLVRKGKVDNC